MSQAYTAHHHVQPVNGKDIATHLEKSVTELQTHPVVLDIGTADATHIERSVFYRDQGKRVYQLNPKEHPAVTGAFDAVLDHIADEYSVDLTRTEPTDAYIITVTDHCSDCEGDTTTTNDAGVEVYYPDEVITKITQCPFKDSSYTCPDALDTESGVIHWSTGDTVTDECDDRIAALTDTPVPATKQHTTRPTTQDPKGKPVKAVGVTLAQRSLDATLAKLIGVLDVIAYVRTHPAIPSGSIDHYPERIDSTTQSPSKAAEQFKSYCNDFLVETAPGWRLRWILEVVNDDPKPLENIAAAANVPVPEARLITKLLEEWNIVSSEQETVVDERRYHFAAEYRDWRDAIEKSGAEVTEPAYLVATGDPVELIEQSYDALTAPIA